MNLEKGKIMQANETASNADLKPYQSPEIDDYGSIEEVTQTNYPGSIDDGEGAAAYTS